MSPVPRLGLPKLARLAGVTVLLASIATASAEDTELTTAATDQHTVSTDTSCVRCDDLHFPLSFVFIPRPKTTRVSQCCHGVLPHILEMYQVIKYKTIIGSALNNQHLYRADYSNYSMHAHVYLDRCIPPGWIENFPSALAAELFA